MKFIPHLTAPQAAHVTGYPFTWGGVMLCVHRAIEARKTGTMWDVSEPMTGRSIVRYAETRALAKLDAARRIDLMGGMPALAYHLAHPIPTEGPTERTGALLSGRHLSAPEFRYAAGGPLDAPDAMPAGSMLAVYRSAPDSSTSFR